ncbi:MAG: hypothetical protein KatS3mg115_2439 [Candidatus Poribacteria bacterium]|nr:MAG: hypothetical protein KatS3mg115_2439 [Candidatus Poribacteria bacterium]
MHIVHIVHHLWPVSELSPLVPCEWARAEKARKIGVFQGFGPAGSRRKEEGETFSKRWVLRELPETSIVHIVHRSSNDTGFARFGGWWVGGGGLLALSWGLQARFPGRRSEEIPAVNGVPKPRRELAGPCGKGGRTRSPALKGTKLVRLRPPDRTHPRKRRDYRLTLAFIAPQKTSSFPKGCTGRIELTISSSSRLVWAR